MFATLAKRHSPPMQVKQLCRDAVDQRVEQIIVDLIEQSKRYRNYWDGLYAFVEECIDKDKPLPKP